jgi:hypothetical protein
MMQHLPAMLALSQGEGAGDSERGRKREGGREGGREGEGGTLASSQIVSLARPCSACRREARGLGGVPRAPGVRRERWWVAAVKRAEEYANPASLRVPGRVPGRVGRGAGAGRQKRARPVGRARRQKRARSLRAAESDQSPSLSRVPEAESSAARKPLLSAREGSGPPPPPARRRLHAARSGSRLVVLGLRQSGPAEPPGPGPSGSCGPGPRARRSGAPAGPPVTRPWLP